MGIIFLVEHPRKDPDTRSISVVGQAVEAVEAVEDVAPISKVHPAACPENSQLRTRKPANNPAQSLQQRISLKLARFSGRWTCRSLRRPRWPLQAVGVIELPSRPRRCVDPEIQAECLSRPASSLRPQRPGL